MSLTSCAGIYADANLSIKATTRVSKIEALKAIIRAWGMEPERILVHEALSEPHRIHVTSEESEERQIAQLSTALRNLLRREVLENTQNGTNLPLE